jgi:hypothetical protein
MERRDFLKGIFGAAVVAVVPKPIVEAIEKAPPETLTPMIQPTVKEVVKSPPLGTMNDGFIYLYDGDVLLAASNQVNLNFHHPNPIQYEVDGYVMYTAGLMRWDIEVRNLRYFNSRMIEAAFSSIKPVKILYHMSNINIHGEAYIAEMTLGIPLEEAFFTDMRLEGTGGLQVILDPDNNEHTAIKNPARAIEGKKTTD